VSQYYRQHWFFCTNQRAEGAERPSCGRCDSDRLRAWFKSRVKALGLHEGPDRVRINSAGCLDRCEEGPCVVVYPEGVWYTFVDESDLDEILNRHLIKGEIVERLRIPDRTG